MKVLREFYDKQQGDTVLEFQDKDGFIFIQRRRHIHKHKASILSVSYPKRILLHNATLISRGTRVFRSVKIGRTVVLFGHCTKCSDPFRIEAGNLCAGNGCARCSGMKKHNINTVRAAFTKRGFKLVSQRYFNAHRKLSYECPMHGLQKINWNNFSSGKGCPGCKIAKASGASSPSWKGGITPIQNRMRRCLSVWKRASFARYGRTCLFTGRSPVTLHHVVSFTTLLQEAMAFLQITATTSAGLSAREFHRLNALMHKKHMAILGIPMSKPTHDSFHIRHGKGCNTPEQLRQFARRYPNHRLPKKF